VPALNRLIRDKPTERVGRAAVESLSRIEPAKPQLREVLHKHGNHSNDALRRNALMSLKNLGPDAFEYLRAIKRGLRDSDKFMRQDAAAVLLAIGPAAEREVVKRLEKGSQEVRKAFFSAMYSFQGELPAYLGPPLLEIMKENDESIVHSAASLIGSTGSGVFPGLIEMAGDGRGAIRSWAIVALCSLTAHTPRTIAVLTDAILRDDHEAILRVRIIAPNADRGVTDLLMGHITHPSPTIRRRAIHSLGEVTDPSPQLVREMVGAFRDPDNHVPSAVCEALAHYGTAAVPLLCDALRSPDPRVHAGAICALTKMGPKAKDAIPALLAAMRTSGDRPSIAGALGAIGPDALAVQAMLIGNPDIKVSLKAVEALGAQGKDSREAADALIDALVDPREPVRQAAKKHLAAAGPRALRPLVAALADERESIQDQLRSVLVEYGDKAVPALHDGFLHESAAARERVRTILREIDTEGARNVLSRDEASR